MNDTVWLLIVICVPSVLSAIVTIFPSFFKRTFSNRYEVKEKNRLQKQKCYINLISSILDALNLQRPSVTIQENTEGEKDKTKAIEETKKEDDEIIRRVRLYANRVYLIGSLNVVETLTDYLHTWGNGSGDEQNQKFRELIKEMRVDLGIDPKIQNDFPQIGLLDIQINRRTISLEALLKQNHKK